MQQKNKPTDFLALTDKNLPQLCLDLIRLVPNLSELTQNPQEIQQLGYIGGKENHVTETRKEFVSWLCRFEEYATPQQLQQLTNGMQPDL